MYDRILVPTDGSSGGERAVEHAVELAATHGAEVHALYVISTVGYGGLPRETSWEGIRDALATEGETALDRIRELTGPADVPVEGTIVEGAPAQRIVEHADEIDCDLIVMGTHGRSGVDRLLLGSVAEHVVRSATVPVLTVRVETADESRAATPGPAGTSEPHGRDEDDR